jgi:hypothetical protein
MRTIGSIYQPSEMAYYTRAPREQNEVLFFCLPHRKIELCVFSQYAE